MRTIALIPDWDSTLFWHDADGQERIDDATFQISDELKRQLNDYYKHFSELYYQDDCRSVPDIEKRLLDDVGLQIWIRLKKELDGVYQVIFHSDERGGPLC